MLAPMSDEGKKRLESLAWRTFTRLVLATAGSIGAKLGEAAVEYILGDKDEDDDEESPG
jgi:hypothetical protein